MKRVLSLTTAAALALAVSAAAFAQEKKGPSEHTMAGCVQKAIEVRSDLTALGLERPGRRTVVVSLVVLNPRVEPPC